jgi:muramidase (phage lysozyme)
MPRKQVEPIGFTEAVRPVASPVDTYQGPPAANAGLMGLAEGLQGLNAGLSAVIQKRAKERMVEDQATAEALAQKNRNVGYSDAVRQGLIPADASKTFVQTYKMTQGSIAGARLAQQAQAAYDSWDGKDSDDPADFDKFLGEFVKNNVNEEDPWVLKGLLPAINDIGTSLGNRYAQDRHAKFYGGLTTAYGAQANQALEAGADNIGEDGKVDYTPAFEAVEKLGADKVAVGVKEEDAWNMAMQTVAATALSRKDPALLDFFDRKVPGKDYTYGETPEGQKLRLETKTSLDNILKSEMSAAYTQQEREDKAKKDAYTASVIEALASDPNAPIPEDVLAGGSKYDSQFRVHVLEWQKTLAEGGHVGDPGRLSTLWTDIINGGKMKADGSRMSMEETFRDALASGVLVNKADIQAAWELSQTVTKAGSKGAALIDGSAARFFIGIVTKRAAADPLDPFAPEGVNDKGAQAILEFRKRVMDWAANHPDATPQEQEDFIQKAGSAMVALFPSEGEQGSGSASVPSSGAPALQGTPNAPPPAQPSPSPSAPPAPGGGQSGTGWGSQYGLPPSGEPSSGSVYPPSAPVGEATGWFQGLSPAAQETVRSTAAKQGLSVDQLIGTVYGNPGLRQSIEAIKGSALPDKQSMAPSTPDGTPVTPASFDPQQATVAIQSATQDIQERDPQLYQAIQSGDIGSAIERLSNYASMAGEFDKVLTEQLDATHTSVGTYTLATIKDDPKAARILDFVSSLESRGNYNAVSGNAKASEDLSQITLAEVIAKQKKGWGGPSSAIGRYQIIRKTMQGLIQQMGLPLTTKFTPELQDRMAVQLLKNRGYDDFVAGKMSSQAFAIQLAMEWASMPRPDTGRSHYAGDAVGNKSLTSASKVMRLLNT